MNYKNIYKYNKQIEEYYKLLSDDIPDFIYEYVNTKELLKQQYISVSCSMIYTDLLKDGMYFSSLHHSIAVALIIWHFTHDKKQTLSGLFHDISTPAFKHCIDFLNGDYMNQESTEDLTETIIKNSSEIMNLLERDNIKLEEVCNYHIYPIADNDTPKLSADRLEYTLSNALYVYNEEKDINIIKEIYNDIYVGKDEKGNIELNFKTKKYARKFVSISSKLSVRYRKDEVRYSMQLIADIIKKLVEEKVITIDDLYIKKETDIIDIIKKSKYKEIYNKWEKAKKVKTSKEEPKNVYYVHHGAKIRYIDPLVNGERISNICKIAKNMIDKNLSYDMNNYVYLDFEF